MRGSLGAHLKLGPLALGWVLVAPVPALALPNDIDMSGLAKWQYGCDPYGSAPCSPEHEPGSTTRVMPDQEAFDGLVEEMASIMSPRPIGPASTGGQSGFDLGVEFTGHRINNQNDYWARSLERSARKDNRSVVYPAMGTAQVWLRKGLPYSFDVAAGGTYLVESRIMAPGIQGKWTLNEGFFWFPDLALTAGANRVLCLGLPSQPPGTDNEKTGGTTLTTCNSDLNMLTVTLGAVTSKTFSFLGMFTLTPYAGWQKIFVHAFSPFIDRSENTNDRIGETWRFRDYRIWGDFVGQECGDPGVAIEDCFVDRSGKTAVPQALNLLTHRNRLYGGLRANFWIVQASLQAEITHVRGTTWDVNAPDFVPQAVRLRGFTTPDFQAAATARLGVLF